MPYVGPAPTPNAPKDLQGGELILDADNDTSITADTDDQIDIKIAGSDEIKITAAMIAPASADGSALGGTSNEWSDLYLADGAVIGLGADQDVTLTHVADTGILLNSTMAIQFNDASQYINAPSNAILDINATDEIELNATAVDLNGTLDVSGTLTVGGIMKTDDATEATSTTDGSLQTDGGLSVVKDAVFGDDLKLLSDSAVIHFGADSDVTVTHDPDDGLILKSNATPDGNPFLLTLQTGETDMEQDDIIGRINFQAPDEGTGTDAILVAARISAMAEGDFSSSSNATKLSFATASSEAAQEKMKLSSTGQLTLSAGSLIPNTDTDTSNTGSVTLDFAVNQNFVLTFTGNVTLANPTTETVGQSGVIVCIQDGTGSRTLSLGTDYETAGGSGITLSTGANDVDVIPYFVKAAGSIQLGAVQKDFS